MKRHLTKILCAVSALSTLNLFAFECPGHPRPLEDIVREAEENNPEYQEERRALDKIDPDGAPHSEEDRKRFANR